MSTPLYALTLAWSAALLFAVQPMVARQALPILGGTPAVWNACMVFFQAVVLAGYALAHGIATRWSWRRQAATFVTLIVLGGITLPIRIGDGDDAASAPVAWLMGRLLAGVGLPALALGTASPLLQRWFARARGNGREPYFLYAASNAGSLGALLAYPLVLEPRFALERQGTLWTSCYWAWALLVAGCAWRARRPQPDAAATLPAAAPLSTTEPAPDLSSGNPTGGFLAWVAWAAIPAGLLQGCTLFLTTDVASLPLLWVVPLGLYLVTFVIAFEPWGLRTVGLARRALPFLAVSLLYAILARATHPVLVLIALHLTFLFAAGLACHGRLVALRPPPEQLTRFYLALSTGGLVGGGLCAFVAPLLFRDVAEYPVAIALACAALPPRGRARAPSERPASWTRDLLFASAAASLMLGLGYALPADSGDGPRWREIFAFGVPAVACCTLLDRPRRLALALGACFAVGFVLQSEWAGNRHAERNFFGITRVARDPDARLHRVYHGNTIHGSQSLDPARRSEPLTYYHRTGPIGRIFAEFRVRHAADVGADRRPKNSIGLPASPRIGVIGLGIGSLAAYGEPGDDWTFFEIDPAMIRVAQDTNWFTFLADGRAGEPRIVVGDARLKLAREEDASFDLLVLDAFSSDAIPVHLLTREALVLYLRKLRPHGWLAAHISNRYLRLEPVFSELAQDAGLVCRSGEDDEGNADGKEASHWMLLARRREDLGRLPNQGFWQETEGSGQVPLWTDQRAAVLPLFDWR